jgi:putative oxygen-independent coproporphyrinogen III oxidase
MQLPPLSLYVHLPWCERKCPYCDFNSHEMAGGSAAIPEQAYVDALIGDLENELRDERRVLHSVFIGGGTPSLFSVDAIARLLTAVRARADLSAGAEITLEANPGSVENSKLAGFREAGVTRFSLGLQSFSNESLQALGRIHDSQAAERAVTAARESGAASFNLDLMHGLPDQDAAAGLADIERAIALSPPHLSWYQLTIEPNTRFYSHPPSLPDDTILGTLEAQGTERLRAAGFERYEVSAWAQPGQACQHNLNYWRFGDYLAIGAGAHGKLSDASGRIQRYAKTRRPQDYLAAAGSSRRGLRWLDNDDRRGEFALNALRLSEGFSLSLFEARTGLPATSIGPVLRELEDQGLLQTDGDRVRASELGWRFLDDVVGRFFAASPDQAVRR